jgi:hypothetical protein
LIQVERTDFVSVPVQDMKRARRFDRDTLGDSEGNALMLHRRYAPVT